MKTASLATQLSAGQLSSVEVEYLGEIADHDVTPLKAAVIKGLLEPVSEENVTIVNANLIAEHRGLRITERKGAYEGIFTNLIQVRAATKEGTTTISGTMGHDGPHIVQINEFWVDVSPGAGYLLICENIDRPGMIGIVGMILGKHGININSMRVAGERGRAMMVLGLDSAGHRRSRQRDGHHSRYLLRPHGQDIDCRHRPIHLTDILQFLIAGLAQPSCILTLYRATTNRIRAVADRGCAIDSQLEGYAGRTGFVSRPTSREQATYPAATGRLSSTGDPLPYLKAVHVYGMQRTLALPDAVICVTGTFGQGPSPSFRLPLRKPARSIVT